MTSNNGDVNNALMCGLDIGASRISMPHSQPEEKRTSPDARPAENCTGIMTQEATNISCINLFREQGRTQSMPDLTSQTPGDPIGESKIQRHRHSMPVFPTEAKRRVSFDSIKIREYQRQLGDNPSCEKGPPISISWDHHNEMEFTVDDYEQYHPNRRDRSELLIPADERADMLMESGHSRKEIWAAVSQVNISKKKRRDSANEDEKVVALMQSVSRKFKRFMKPKSKKKLLKCGKMYLKAKWPFPIWEKPRKEI